MSEAKAKINLREGIIELEGTESFVKEYLNEFKTLLNQTNTENFSKTETNKVHMENDASVKTKVSKKSTSKKKSAPIVTSERFEIHANGNTPSLEAFLAEKNPGKANGEKIVCIGYYIIEHLKLQVFTEGQIEYAYKMMKFTRPAHLHQIMLNTKSESDWFEQDSESSTSWNLTRSGEIYVSESLPKKIDK